MLPGDAHDRRQHGLKVGEPRSRNEYGGLLEPRRRPHLDRTCGHRGQVCVGLVLRKRRLEDVPPERPGQGLLDPGHDRHHLDLTVE